MNKRSGNYTEVKPHFAKRILWKIVNTTIFRLCCFPATRSISRALLQSFGAKVGVGTTIYGQSNIFAPWNLEIGNYSCIGPDAIIYNKDKVIIGDHCVISQRANLCTASHDISDPKFTLITKPITIKDMAWVASDTLIGMGVTIEEGAVVGARAAVFKSVEPWTVVGGNPAKFIKYREKIK